MIKDDVSKLYDVVVVSIDPTETPDQAAMMRKDFIDSYNRPGTEDGFKFLVGDAENIDRLADEVGFRFYRDPKNGRITHPAGLMVLSPERRVCRYFLDQEFSAKMVQLALKDARDEVVGDRDDRPFFLACIDIDPLTGQRSINVMNTVRTGGLATVIVLIISVILMNRGAKANHVNDNSNEAQNE
ncbi:hypothetical protein QM565_14045 [Geitlerinema splendidum]|nr:hypothetical protein [Geitlerinema splendidum]